MKTVKQMFAMLLMIAYIFAGVFFTIGGIGLDEDMQKWWAVGAIAFLVCIPLHIKLFTWVGKDLIDKQ
jgi:hypothetical protein